MLHFCMQCMYVCMIRRLSGRIGISVRESFQFTHFKSCVQIPQKSTRHPVIIANPFHLRKHSVCLSQLRALRYSKQKNIPQSHQKIASVDPKATPSFSLYLTDAIYVTTSKFEWLSAIFGDNLYFARMLYNPCCCISPRIGAFVFAVIDLVFAVSLSWAAIVSIFDHGLKTELIVEIVVCAVLVAMAILLFLGAWKNSAEKIRLWLIMWIVFLIVSLALALLNIWSHHAVGTRMGASLGGWLLLVYQIWVVYAYLTELRCGPAGLKYCITQINV